MCFSDTIMSESRKKGSKSSRKHCFLKFPYKRKLHEQVLKIEISTFLKILKIECSDVQKSRYFSQKSCVPMTEFSRETMFSKIKFFVLRND